MECFVVTGANRGIGLELTTRLVEAGRHVVATCRDPQVAHELRALENAGSLEIHALEVSDGEAVSHLCEQLGGRSVDALVNNAGIMGGERQSLDDMDYEAWEEAFVVNTLAPFRLTTALRPNLMRADRPRVVTLSSQMGSLGRKSKGAFAYRSSKAAVNKVMQVLALELESDGIIVCPVHPGWVRTDMGGVVADISVEECVSGLMELIESLTMDQSGRFWTWEGKEHPW